MRELLATGWMHNRLRMVTAMFLSKNLFLNWRLGERYFMRQLVDGDLAANKLLAEQRAAAAKAYLVEAGVDPNRIRAVGGEPSGRTSVSFVLGQPPY